MGNKNNKSLEKSSDNLEKPLCEYSSESLYEEKEESILNPLYKYLSVSINECIVIKNRQQRPGIRIRIDIDNGLFMRVMLFNFQKLQKHPEKLTNEECVIAVLKNQSMAELDYNGRLLLNITIPLDDNGRVLFIPVKLPIK